MMIRNNIILITQFVYSLFKLGKNYMMYLMHKNAILCDNKGSNLPQENMQNQVSAST